MTLTEEQRAAIHAVSGLLTAIGCPQCHSYLQKNYTHHIEVLRAMTDSSEHFSDATKMIGFDMEKARASIAHYRIENPSNVDTESALKELVDQANLAEDALAEIERLRAEISEQKGMIWKTQQVKKEQAAQIKSLEDALAEERAKVIMLIEKLQLVANDPDWQSKGLKHDFDWYLAESKKQIESGEPEDQRCRRLGEPNGRTDPKGKIGPDADAKPQVWQITEERVGLLEYCLESLLDAPDIDDYSEPRQSIRMLRAMLKEAL